MALNRRDLLRAGVTAGALVATPRWLHGLGHSAARPAALYLPPIADPTVRELALRAVEAARAAGASYADVRLTHTRERVVTLGVGEEAWVDVGVRALVDGYWGFAAGTLWTPEAVARLGAEAAAQAKTNALGQPRMTDLGRVPVVQDGHWAHPVERDPFDAVHEDEVLDYLESLRIYVSRSRAQLKLRPGSLQSTSVRFVRQEKAFASSEGSFWTQRLYRTAATLTLRVVNGRDEVKVSPPIVPGASRGWEYITATPVREELDRVIDEIHADLALPLKPVEVGRYDLVCDAQSMAHLLDGTLGAATELDRALGYEANATGTSYLNDPAGMLGSYQAGAPLLTVLGERSAPGGLATVKWDDEGVEPDRFPIVQDGVLVDFQTHREATGWLERGARRSHGCAAAPRAFDAPMIHTPNLTLQPAQEALDFDALVGGMKKGLAVRQLGATMDFQCLNGFGQGRQSGVFEVRDGKRVARLAGAGFLFRAPELWKGLLALGGATSQRPFALHRRKGEPWQETWHTVTAVPGVVKQVTTIEAGRKA